MLQGAGGFANLTSQFTRGKYTSKRISKRLQGESGGNIAVRNNRVFQKRKNLGHSIQKIFLNSAILGKYREFSSEFAPWKCLLKIFFSLWPKSFPSLVLVSQTKTFESLPFLLGNIGLFYCLEIAKRTK